MQQPSMGKSIPNSDWVSDKGIELKKEDLPELPGYHVLVQPLSIKQKTKGGIILPDSTKDDIAYLTTVGKVLALGELAYRDSEKFLFGPWCQEGDYVAYGKFVGQKLQYKGVKMILLFDDQIIMRVDKPSDLDPTFNLSN
jgi:co-chaperonin GroES (HSP10)